MNDRRIFSPTEKQRKELDRLWRSYDRAARAPKSDLMELHKGDARRRIEDTITANLAGFDTPEEHINA